MTTTLPPQVTQPDVRGWLAFTAPLPDELQRAEDSTQLHDFTFGHGDQHERPATEAERTLLAALGHTVPDELTTTVTLPSALVRRRRWLQLETTEGNEP